MTQRIRQQAHQFWQTLSCPDSRQSYQAAASTTWMILKEGGLLLWLLVCLVLVSLDWSVAAAIAAGRASRDMVGRLGEAQPDAIASNTKQTLLTAGRTGLSATLAQAREQLGLSSGSKTDVQAAATTAPVPTATVPAKPDASGTPVSATADTSESTASEMP